MSIEAEIKALREAIEANTAAVKAAGGTAATSSKGTASKPAKETPAGPKNTREAMAALLKQVKAKFDEDTAKGIIADVGGVPKMAEIPDDKIDAVFDAATAKLEEESM